VSKQLAGIVAPATVEGEAVPPCQQKQLSASERSEKTARVMNSALNMQKIALANKFDSGYPVNYTVRTPSTGTSTSPAPESRTPSKPPFTELPRWSQQQEERVDRFKNKYVTQESGM